MLAIAPIQLSDDGSFTMPPTSDASRCVTSRRDYLARIGEIHKSGNIEAVQPETDDATRAWKLILERNTSDEFDGCDIIALRHRVTGKLAFTALEPYDDDEGDDD